MPELVYGVIVLTVFAIAVAIVIILLSVLSLEMIVEAFSRKVDREVESKKRSLQKYGMCNSLEFFRFKDDGDRSEFHYYCLYGPESKTKDNIFVDIASDIVQKLVVLSKLVVKGFKT